MLIKNIRYPQLDIAPKKQSLITFKSIFFVVTICSIVAVFTNCTSQREVRAELETIKVCQDGYWYEIKGTTSKKIVVKDGRFAKCESNEIIF